MTSPRTLLLLALASFLPACGDEPGGTPAGDDPPAHTPEFDFAPGGPISDAQLAEFHVELDVSFNGAPLGTLVFELWPTLSPRSVRRFLRHAAERAYDRAPFHRVAREFIVQGGDPTGTGDTLSPYGLIPAELSADPSFDHGYGVLTMIPDSSMQFFICVAESPRVWALDEQPFSRLGKLTAGVPTLEQVANVPVGFGGMEGERTAPVGKLLLESVRVVRGPAPTGELIRRPPIDLQGQPEVVAVEHIFVTFTDRSNDPDLIRNRVEAQARAQECLARLESGELAWEDALREYTDEDLERHEPIPRRRMSNYRVLRIEGQRARLDANREMRRYQMELRQLLASEVISDVELLRRQAERKSELATRLREIGMERREDVPEVAYTNLAFTLEIGEIGLVSYDAFASPRGWYLLRRVE